jgi:putative aldouronate transport system substrate-binding protein
MNPTVKKFSLASLGLIATIAVGFVAAQNTAPVEVTFTAPGGAAPKDQAKVERAINAYLKGKVNATVKFNYIDWGAWDQRMNLMYSAGEKCDILFTAQWGNDFNRNARQGNFADLTEALQRVTPKLYKAYPAWVWDAGKSGNKIYGVPTGTGWTPRFGPHFRKDLLTKYNFDLSKVRKLEDLEPFLAAVKKGEPSVTPLLTSDNDWGRLYYDLMLDAVPWRAQYVFVRSRDKDMKVFNAFEDPAFIKLLQLQRRWYQAGYYTKDITPHSDAMNNLKAGKYAGYIKEADELSYIGDEANFGGQWAAKAITAPYLMTHVLQGSMNSICRTTDNLNESLKVIELLHTDQNFYNLVANGIEGDHWVFTDKTKKLIDFPKGVTAQTSIYNPGSGWQYGNGFLAYPREEIQIQGAKAAQTANRTARRATVFGFVFDDTSVKTEMAQLEAVKKELGTPIDYGMVDLEKNLPILQKRLKDAGIDKVIAEMQRQINAWRKANNK